MLNWKPQLVRPTVPPLDGKPAVVEEMKAGNRTGSPLERHESFASARVDDADVAAREAHREQPLVNAGR